MSKDKKRVELKIDRTIDHDVVQFLENNVDNQAGFIKNLLRQYVRGELVQNKPLNHYSPEPKEPVEATEDIQPSTTKNTEQQRKKLPLTALSSMSSKNINKDERQDS
jgi:hypothetical protein